MFNSEFIVHASRHSRKNCPVVVEFPIPKDQSAKAVTVTSKEGKQFAAQITPPHPFLPDASTDNHMRVTFILPELAAGESQRFRAQLTDELANTPPHITVHDDKAGSVVINIDQKLFTIYRYLQDPVRPCFFPLLGPGGKQVTRSWPLTTDVPGEAQDHIHHRSMWVAYGDVNRVDNWLEEGNHGFQLHKEILSISSGLVYGQLAASNDWTDHEKNKILEERRALTVYNISDDSRLFDLDVCFTATERDVRFGDTKEGGIIATRVACAMNGEHSGLIKNSYGAITEAECWGRRAQWCDYSGTIEGEQLGLAIFDHPSSFRHPTYWHVRNYGMYTANPFGWHDFTGDPAVDGSHVLPKGASLIFRYRVYLHRGDASTAKVSERYHDYANPPEVEIET